MSKIISILETAKWLSENDNYLIITHRRPDGDTLGCAGALAQGLRELGKCAYIFENHEVTPRYLPFVEDYTAPADFSADQIIAVDIATTELFTKSALEYKDKIALCIDHHNSNTNYSELLCIDASRAACGELIYDILTDLAGSISKTTATCLYVALSTDTGCFSYGNTTADTLTIAAQLIKAGAPNKQLNKLLFRTKTHGRILIEGMITSNMEFHFDDKVAIVKITREMMNSSKATEDDIDDIASLPGSVEGVGIGITIRELSSPTDCKISVRATPPYNAHELCAKFGGGGHITAAGASIKKTVDEIKADLLDELKRNFDN
ncbi:MAG: DHH family phosphoesterase [Oscillospiraceae bacterium]|nr:DHH family phosphoesterase [Oscillospiraceae bacterium]